MKIWVAASLVTFAVGLVPAGGELRAQERGSRSLATVDGVSIGQDDVDALVGPVLWPLETRLHAIRQQALDALIKQRLLEREAARRKISLQTLIDTEVTAKAGHLTEQDIDKAKGAGPASLSREDVKQSLLKERIGVELNRFVATLEKRSAVRVLLEAPRAPRAMLEGSGAPSKGQPDAPITIVEFTDFHCSYCRDVEGVLERVMSRYPVRIVHRDLPIETVHPHAREAHEAARCADEQGRFWAFRAALFTGAAKQGADLKAAAQLARLDAAAFETCVAAGTVRAVIDSDAADAKRLGVKTTPTFFVNGRELQGPPTLDAFVAAIQNELPGRSRSPRHPRSK